MPTKLLEVLATEILGSVLILSGISILATLTFTVIYHSSNYNILGAPRHTAHHLVWKRAQASIGIIILSIYSLFIDPDKIISFLSNYFNYSILVVASIGIFIILWAILGILGYIYSMEKLDLFDSSALKFPAIQVIILAPILLVWVSFFILTECGQNVWWQYIVVVIPSTIIVTLLTTWLVNGLKRFISKK